MSRPGIAVILPTFHGPVVICDVGANIAPKPRHLQQYAIMAGAYATAVCGIENPRVGLLSHRRGRRQGQPAWSRKRAS